MLSPVKHIARANTEKKHDRTLDRKNMTSLTTSASLIFVCTYEFYAHKYNFRLPFTQSPILSRFNATILTKTDMSMKMFKPISTLPKITTKLPARQSPVLMRNVTTSPKRNLWVQHWERMM